MKRTLRLALSLVVCLFVLTGAALAANFPYPVWSTAADGTVAYGYLDDAGAAVIPLRYDEAGAFGGCGLAAVGFEGKTALVNVSGELVTEWVERPETVDFNESWAAFRYADGTVYYNAAGQALPRMAGASGFPSDGRIAFSVQSDANTLWGYYDEQGRTVIPAVWSAAGAFSEGRALVRDILGDVHIIGVDGSEQAALPGGATPVYLDIFCDDVIVLEAGGKQCLYSLGQMNFLTYYIYDEILPFDRNCAIMRQGMLYGLLTAGGAESLPATYPYLNALGEGVYTARGLSMGAELIDEQGRKVYTLDTYVGGLNDLNCGMTWYGTLTGDVAFLNSTGTFVKVVPGVERPEILTSNVARVTVDNETRWIDMLTGEVLHSSARRYTLLNGAKVSTAYYEKYLGMRPDGSEYGWSVEYPLLTGLADLSAQQKINDGLRDFFVGGPYHSMLQNCGLTATYGYAEQDGLLIVWAIGTYETADTAVVWNESIIFDLATGTRYTVEENLFRAGSSSALLALLPAGSPYYGNARVTAEGVCFYRNYPVPTGSKPYSESICFGYDALASVLDYASPLCQRLTGIEALSYTDVPQTYWGYRVISTCTARGLMIGSDGKFFPVRTISLSEVAAVLARVLELPAGEMPGINQSAWYADELGAAYEAGLLAGLSERAQQPSSLITRADMMQMLANTIAQRGVRVLSSSAAAEVLAPFADAAEVPSDRVQAAATCVQAGVIVGDGTSLRPNDTLTRAEFAAILSALVA